MEPIYAQQEILLLTGTTLAATNLCNMSETEGKEDLTTNERLEEACWNGVLRELLPEVYLQPGEGRNLFLWQIREGESVLEINLGEVPLPIDRAFSIIPHYFIAEILCN
ncbi:MAG: hypothetical protein Q8927_17720 [Bacteroidota bacterium]|nr:hypothetical protein [Bacteroidota bacterium]MDP4245236.1 hypothetical protein [Bacteroidota bacterium]MDP4255891.1 hypothetical protein [Bacteroidota bacterium]MDP4260308.1 hypothetical protein [Bacteroidota bacterium]